MREWKPKMYDTNTGNLVIDKTSINCSEGDTLFIRQENWNNEPQVVAIGRYELYDIIFNFMSTNELIGLLEKREQEKVF